MTVSEYEERFRSPALSLHQTLAANRGPVQGRQRGRYLWLAAALVGVMTMTCQVASHRAGHAEAGDGSQALKSSIREPAR
jgi:hypothetical protein